MPKEILLAPNFRLPSAVVTESIAIMGRKGRGKTYTGGRLFEQMYAAGAQCVALDPVGNWWGLRLSATGKRQGLNIPVFGGDHGDVPITPESGKLMAEVVVSRKISCVIDLMLFKKGERKKFVTDFAEELFHQKKKMRSPLHMFLEEARKFIPQRPMSPDENRMIGAFEDIVRLGRNYGLGSTMLDQRPQSVNKEVLSQVEVFIVHQLTEKHGRKEIEDWVRAKDVEGADQLKEIAKLEAGEAFIWSPGLLGKFARVKVGKKKTYDASSTPELGKDDDSTEVRPLSAKDMVWLRDSMSTVVKEVEAKDPRKLRKDLAVATATIEDLRRELERRPELKAKVERVEVPIIDSQLVGKVDKAVEKVHTHFNRVSKELSALTDEIKQVADLKRKLTEKAPSGGLRSNKMAPATNGRSVAIKPHPQRKEPSGSLTGPEQRILDALAWMETIGVPDPEVAAVAFLAGYKVNGGAFNNPRGKLRGQGLIDYLPGKKMCLTEEGRRLAVPPELELTTEKLHQAVLNRLPGPEGRILSPLLDAWPESLSSEDLAQAAGYEPKGGAFNNPRGRLRTLGLIDYPSPGHARANDFLFLA